MAVEMIDVSVRAEGKVWETAFADIATPYQIAYAIRAYMGWKCELTDIDMKLVGRQVDRVFSEGTFGDAARFAKSQFQVELIADVRV